MKLQRPLSARNWSNPADIQPPSISICSLQWFMSGLCHGSAFGVNRSSIDSAVSQLERKASRVQKPYSPYFTKLVPTVPFTSEQLEVYCTSQLLINALTGQLKFSASIAGIGACADIPVVSEQGHGFAQISLWIST
jgi:hypothetical protein